MNERRRRMRGGNDDTGAAETRLERWKKSEFLRWSRFTYGWEPSTQDEQLIEALGKANEAFYAEHPEEREEPTASDIVSACKELIYDVRDGETVFHAIVYTFNVRRAEIEVGPLLEILVNGETQEEKEDQIRSTLAYAFFAEVPVYPNSEELAEDLARYYRDLMVRGFTAPNEKGERVRLRPTKSPGRKIETIEFLRSLRIGEPRQPAEFALIRRAVEDELERLSTADRVMASLTIAIDELTKGLSARGRNESKLQQCLTKHPILFGLEYRQVLPKHKLGGEYEMDYALERVSGLVDLMEIEPSNFSLFNKKGDSSNHLVHAEQQVLDWLEWLERNHAYARERLSELVRPVGYVVIGRSTGLTDGTRRKLARRNATFGGAVRVLTYDDLLVRAENMRDVLLGEKRLVSRARSERHVR